MLERVSVSELIQIRRYFDGALRACRDNDEFEVQANSESLRDLVDGAYTAGRLDDRDLVEILQVFLRHPEIYRHGQSLFLSIRQVYDCRPYQEGSIRMLLMRNLLKNH
ncbi:hypothetical protein [Pseudomonas putida]|uniref:hypothetical protein n=1 Tax=Pseudomonas putida TaxID=303 RepID=UPI000360506C|nr:hypothetical protein [Pseudomonas putida]